MSCNHEYFFGLVSHVWRELLRLKPAPDLGNTSVAQRETAILQSPPSRRSAGNWIGSTLATGTRDKVDGI
jgi:hypothetical protein